MVRQERSAQMRMTAEPALERDLTEAQLRSLEQVSGLFYSETPEVFADGSPEVSPEFPGQVNFMTTRSCSNLRQSERHLHVVLHELARGV